MVLDTKDGSGSAATEAAKLSLSRLGAYLALPDVENLFCRFCSERTSMTSSVYRFASSLICRWALAVAVLSASLLLTTAAARAENMKITVSGTVATASPGMGFTVGQPVSLFWEVNDYAPRTPVGSVTSGDNYFWEEELDTDPALYTSVGGTGISGTYRRLSGPRAPYEDLAAFATGILELYTDNDDFSAAVNHGIFLTADPDYFVDRIYARNLMLSAPGFSGFALGATLPNPAEYLAGYAGSYSVTGDPIEFFATNFISAIPLSLKATFTPTSVSIAPVPEIDPAGMGSVLALVTGALGLLERRRLKSKVA